MHIPFISRLTGNKDKEEGRQSLAPGRTPVSRAFAAKSRCKEEETGMRQRSLKLNQIRINDPFWSKHVDLVRNAIIPYQWDAITDQVPDAAPSHSLQNFKIAAGLEEGEFYGMPFQDTDVAKWLEAVGYTLGCYPDPELEARADGVIDIIEKAQREDGYLDTYYMDHPELRWTNLKEAHELYTAGHMMEAAVAYYEGTGKRKLLDVMCRMADLICDTFGFEEGKIPGYPGHEEVEIGLIRLWQVTGEKKYLDQAKYFIDARGVGECYFQKEEKGPKYKSIFGAYFSEWTPEYAQAHLPVRQQTTAEGHSVRATYLYCAMADLAEACQDEELLKACETLWNNITQKRMYLTGGIGSSGHLERFTTDYDLPNASNYSESCASIGLALFSLRMNQITGEAKYMDTAEQALYNTVLAGIALDGKSFFYVNPLEVWPPACMPGTSMSHVKSIRQKWFGVACCPPNIARTLASLGQYIYAVNREKKALYVNLFVSNEAEVNFAGTASACCGTSQTEGGQSGAGKNTDTHVCVQTRFPYEGKLTVSVTKVPDGGLDLYIRIPAYAKNYTVCDAADGKTAEAEVLPEGYCKVHLSEDAALCVSFDMPPHYVYANGNVRADAGKAAIMRGPFVYCLEECDNGANLAAIAADVNAPLTLEQSDLFGGCTLVKGSGTRLVRKEDCEDPSAPLYSDVPPVEEAVSFTAIP